MSTFHAAFVFLPRRQRRALEAVYKFCRIVDDIVDELPATSNLEFQARYRKVASDALDEWRRELDRVYAQRPTHPVGSEIANALDSFPLPQEAFVNVIDGCAMDLANQRYETWEELRTYCYRVASSVGLLCIEIFGYRERAHAQGYAVDLGIALQLTNILRDVQEDSRRGRLYLPTEDLARFGCSEAAILERAPPPAGRSRAATRERDPVEALLAFEGQRARHHFQRAREQLGPRDRRSLVVAEVLGDLYFELLESIEAVHYDVWTHPVRLTKPQALTVATRSYLGHRVDSLWHSVRSLRQLGA